MTDLQTCLKDIVRQVLFARSGSKLHQQSLSTAWFHDSLYTIIYTP